MEKISEYAISYGVEAKTPLLDVITELRGITGEEPLKDYFKEEYEGVVKNLDTARVHANTVEAYLRGLREKTISSFDISHPRFRGFLESTQYIALIDRIIVKVLIILLKASGLEDYSLETRYLKIAQVRRKHTYLVYDHEIEREGNKPVQNESEDDDQEI